MFTARFSAPFALALLAGCLSNDNVCDRHSPDFDPHSAFCRDYCEEARCPGINEVAVFDDTKGCVCVPCSGDSCAAPNINLNNQTFELDANLEIAFLEYDTGNIVFMRSDNGSLRDDGVINIGHIGGYQIDYAPDGSKIAVVTGDDVLIILDAGSRSIVDQISGVDDFLWSPSATLWTFETDHCVIQRFFDGTQNQRFCPDGDGMFLNLAPHPTDRSRWAYEGMTLEYFDKSLFLVANNTATLISEAEAAFIPFWDRSGSTLLWQSIGSNDQGYINASVDFRTSRVVAYHDRGISFARPSPAADTLAVEADSISPGLFVLPTNSDYVDLSSLTPVYSSGSTFRYEWADGDHFLIDNYDYEAKTTTSQLVNIQNKSRHTLKTFNTLSIFSSARSL